MNQLRSAQQRVLPRLREGYGDRIGGKLGAGSQAGALLDIPII